LIGVDIKKKESPEKKYDGLSRIVGNEDWIPFRKPMSWFNKTDKNLDFDSINSKDLVVKLWPKGSELLF
jgi:hypothetical protein